MGAFAPPEAARMALPSGSDLPLWQLHATLALVRGAVRGGANLDELLARHAVLHDSLNAAAELGLAELTLDAALARLAARLQSDTASPLQRLRAALGLDVDGLCCGVVATLADHEPQLAAFIDELHGQAGQPTRATLTRAFGAVPAGAAVAAMCEAGVLQEVARGLLAPRALWALAAGGPAPRSHWRHRPHGSLPTLDQLILPEQLRAAIAAAWRSAASRPQLWQLRGGPGSGRQTLAGALAQARGLGLVEAVDASMAPALGAAAAMLDAMPLARFDLAPGEVLQGSLPAAAPPWLAACLPRHGALRVRGADSHRLELEAPDAAERRRHWQLALAGHEPEPALLDLRLPRGTLHRVARRVVQQGMQKATPQAGYQAGLGPPDAIDPATDPPISPTIALDQVIAAVTEEGCHALEGIARAVPAATPDEAFALGDETREEFEALVRRCRHRDRLAAALPSAFGHTSGVRALFKGPSGTGKTLAARQLAAALHRPLYRVDLAATVSKYIGETERNLERVFEAAEALDIVLLLDEGDALLAGRTGVNNATDRYANLETNYLLQRLEHYSGVLVITTNAADRIDTAFARRLDVSIDFPLPDAPTRLALWQAHLGAQHAVPAPMLEAVALRCNLAGGQIRNAALHAALLAMERGLPVQAEDLLPALAREYRKAGQRCPSFEAGA